MALKLVTEQPSVKSVFYSRMAVEENIRMDVYKKSADLKGEGIYMKRMALDLDLAGSQCDAKGSVYRLHLGGRECADVISQF
jgi:hypothetical protein